MGAHTPAPRSPSGRDDDLAAARLLEHVSVISNEAVSFTDAIREALDAVCAYTGWPVGHAYIPLERNDEELAPTGVWHVSDVERFAHFMNVTERTPLKRGSGLPGRVWETGTPAWITDVSTDENFPRNRHGEIVVRGGFAFPVLAFRRMVAVMEFFSDKCEQPDEELLELVSHVGTQLGRVAEREAAADTLLKQSEEIIGLIELAYDAFVSIDTHGVITGWNAAAEAMFGWTREEAVGRPLAETIVPPAFRDAHRRGLARFLETREGRVLNRYVELSAIRRSGEEFPVELAIWPIGTDSQTTFCAFVRDISRRREAEAEVARLATIVQSSHDAMIAKSLDGTIFSWNSGAEQMYGYTTDEVIGRSISILVPETHAEELDEIMDRLGRGQSIAQYETVRRRKDGELIDVSLTISPIKDATGAVIGAATIARDVSARKKAEEGLRENERRLLEAQEMVHMGSWEWDIDADVVTWSDQLYRNFGVDPATFVPSFESYLALLHPGDRDRIRSIVEQAFVDHQHFAFEHRMVMADGSIRINACTGDVVVENGRAVRMTGTSQDVTEWHEAKERLVAAYEHERAMVRKLKEADAAKTSFVSSVSHELRTPLTSITGYVDLLLDGDDLTDAHREMLDVVQRNSKRLLNLIEDLLTVSRLETGTFKVSIEPIAIRALVSGALEAVLPNARDVGVDLTADVSPDSGYVMGDPVQLERMLFNLLSNALKFTPSGGRVRVQAKGDGDHVALSVADTGIGIAEEEQSKLFTRFFRASNADQAQGTGLGLSIVKAIVEDHGGTIDVQSALGRGTTVTVRFRTVKADTMAESA